MGRQMSLFKSHKQRGIEPPPPSEFEIHCAVADVLRRWASPGWMWHHPASGEHREWATANRLRRMGVRRGWPDIELLCPLPVRVHFLELKSEKGKLSREQLSFQHWCLDNEVPYAVAHSFKDAVDILQNWGAVRAVVSA